MKNTGFAAKYFRAKPIDRKDNFRVVTQAIVTRISCAAINLIYKVI